MTNPFSDLFELYPTASWVIFAIIWIAVATGAVAGLSAAPWVPTKRREKKALVKSLEIKPGQIIYDLGCGTGTLLFALAKENTKANFIGCEISVIPYLIAKLRALKYKNVQIKYKNLFKQSIDNADIIIIFLLTKAYDRLKEKFKAELKDEALIAVQGWAMENIKPSKVLKTDKALPFYIYKGSDFR
ncbi:methyltransferase domain-containing protein [Candidatus Uhrbacteria bacterium]|jgi:cyclopropane fatty-acyl-phospholipid synthase-like methyltransferase|nr:methyltransferase domain-containing protein [Candidatus Uhrbacteria bacterium]MBT7716817.1 methyltransferase domain-containing protein [Candidatus Uhrbacteria bacterium]